MIDDAETKALIPRLVNRLQRTMAIMFNATYLDFSNHEGGDALAGWYITGSDGSLLSNAHAYPTQAECLMAISRIG